MTPSLCYGCGECGFQYHFNPGVGAAAIIMDHETRVLLLRRGREPGRGKFGLPGGFVDVGESVEQALRREVLEEVNLIVTQLRYVCSLPNDYAYHGIEYQLVDLFFLASVESFTSLRCQQGEVERVEFHRVGEFDLRDMAFASNRQAILAAAEMG